MPHALIIDDNMIICRANQTRLETLGFTSFDHAWTERQAVAAAGARIPDLVVVGDEIAEGRSLDAAKCIAEQFAVPVLLVTCDVHRARRIAGKECTFEGPFPINQIGDAVALIRRDASVSRSPLAPGELQRL